jgi:hypothetical protein
MLIIPNCTTISCQIVQLIDFCELQNCLSEIKQWMNSNELKLNPDKNECYWDQIHPTKASLLLPTFHITISCKSCQTCLIALCNFHRIKMYLPKTVAIDMSNALISSCKQITVLIFSDKIKTIQDSFVDHSHVFDMQHTHCPALFHNFRMVA